MRTIRPMNNTIVLALLTLAGTLMMAQPTDSQVLLDIKKPGVVKAELRPGTIKKVWSSSNSQYYWDRAVVVWRMGMIQKNLRGVLGEYKYTNIVGKLHYLRYPENGGPTWDSQTHLTVPVETAYERKEARHGRWCTPTDSACTSIATRFTVHGRTRW